jgi:hypothetical protein
MTSRRRARSAPGTTDASASERVRVTRLTCHAPDPDPDRAGERCGTLLAYARGEFVFVTTADHVPETLDEVARTALEQESADTWLRCSAQRCGKWNRFRIVGS